MKMITTPTLGCKNTYCNNSHYDNSHFVHRNKLNRHALLAIAISCAFYSTGSYSSASDPASAEKSSIDTLTVIAKPIQSPNGKIDGYIATNSTSATKTDTPLIETPQAISVITRDEMTAHNAQSVGEALRYSSGVVQTNGAYSSRFDSLNIRGFDVSSTGMMRDGLRSTTGQAWPKIDPYGLERVDVIRGPSSVLYGQNSPGGIVNQITKRPLFQPYHEVEVQAGNFSRKQMQADFSGPVADSSEYFYRLTGLVRDSDTQIDHVVDDKVFIAPSLTWMPNENTTLTILADYSYDKFGAPRPFLPLNGSLLSNPNGKVSPNVFLDQPNLKNDRTQYSLGYQLDHYIDDIWQLHSGARFSHVDLTTNIAQGMFLDNDMRTLNRMAYHFRIKGDVYSLDNNVQAKWLLDDIQMTSLMGIDYRHTREDYLLKAGKASSIDIFDPQYGGEFGPLDNEMANRLQFADQVGIYLQQQAKLDNGFIFIASGRQDWSESRSRNRQDNQLTKQSDNKFTYRVASLYESQIGLSPYISYSTSFIPELGMDFYGKNFKPLEGKQTEIGLKYQPQDSNTNITLALYELKQKNMLTADPDNVNNQIQIGEVRSRGAELQAAYSPIDEFTLTAALTYNKIKNTETNNPAQKDKRPVGLPEKSASLWADYKFLAGQLDGLGLAAGVRYIGSTPVDNQNTFYNPSSTLFDAAMSYELGGASSALQGWRLGINVNNLTNKHYYSSCSMGGCSVGFDRTVIASLRYRW